MLGKPCLGGVLAAPTLATVLLSSATLFAQTAPATSPGTTPTPVAPPPTASPPAASPPAAAPGTTTVYCLPACRAGYMCIEGKCISACNPPCGANEKCTAAGQCESTAPPATMVAPVPIAVNVTMAPPTTTTPADPGWATGAGVFGVVAAVGSFGLILGSEFTKEELTPSLPLGVAGTVLIAIAGPITAVGAGSARSGGDVKGAQGLRIVGWLAYGLALVDASVLIGLGVNEVEPPDGVIALTGALGATALLSLAGDAFFSAAEANAKREATQPATFNVAPTITWAQAHDGESLPILGARGTF